MADVSGTVKGVRRTGTTTVVALAGEVGRERTSDVFEFGLPHTHTDRYCYGAANRRLNSWPHAGCEVD